MRLCLPWVIPVLLLAATAQAAVHRVPTEYSTIQAATDIAAAGDTVLVAPGTYSDYSVRTLGSNPFEAAAMVFLKSGVFLVSEGGSSTTTLDMLGEGQGDQVAGVFAFAETGAQMHVEGFRITGVPAEDRGMLLWNSAKTVLRDCVFNSQNGGHTQLGGMYAYSTDVELHDCRFFSCAGDYGLDVHDGDTLAEDCLFEGCSGGVLHRRGPTSDAVAVFRRCTFRDNDAAGGLAISDATSALVEECVFEGNYGPIGAAINVYQSLSVTIRDNLLFGNTAADGAGIVWVYSEGVIRGNTFYGNTTTSPGGGVDVSVLAPTGGLNTQIKNNIFSAAMGSEAVKGGGGAPTAACNLFWRNQDGDFDAWWPPNAEDILADPRFCNAEGGDFTVDALSPCLPENSGGCGRIGALGQGCGSVSVVPLNWSEIKNAYRGASRIEGAR